MNKREKNRRKNLHKRMQKQMAVKLLAVEAIRDEGKSNQDIVARLMTKYSLTQEQAKGYVQVPVIQWLGG